MQSANEGLYYSDNIRVYDYHKSCACRWHVRIDGKTCPSGAIMGDSGSQMVLRPNFCISYSETKLTMKGPQERAENAGRVNKAS